MKFRNINTGSILEPKTKMVEIQMAKSPDFEEYKEPAAAPAGKPLDKMTKAELEALAAEKGIEIPNGAKKEEMVELLKKAE